MKTKSVPSLRGVIDDAKYKGIALGHFNVSNLDGFHAVADAARAVGVPVIIGLSEGERDYVGVKQAAAIVKSLREVGQAIYLNADHTYSLERIKEVVDAGFDSVIIDAADKPLADNIEITRAVVTYAKSADQEVLVEGELGYIGKSSKFLDKIPAELVSAQNMTNSDMASEYIGATKIDLLAPAVGNVHGMLKGGSNPRLNIERISDLATKTNVPLVLHGGSGIADEDFTLAIKAGIRIIHINTELRVAYRQALQTYLADNPDELSPYKYMNAGKVEMREVIEKRLRLFSNEN